MAISMVSASIKSPDDYVNSVESQFARNETDVNWHVGLQKRTTVALQVLNDACDNREISYSEWQALSRRIYAVQDALVEGDFWR